MKHDYWSDLELRHLVALQAVAQERSFHRAALRLGYTQSAVSQHIAALEGIVGERLIERSRGRKLLTLTEAGQLLLRHGEAIVARLHAARADLAAFSRGEAGALRVGTYQSVGTRILPMLMRAFRAAWPGVEVRLAEGANDERLLPLIERGELDLTFAIFPLPDGPFEAVELMRDPWVMIVPTGSPLATRERAPTLMDIADMPLIGFHHSRGADDGEAELRRRGIEPRIIFRSNDNGTVQGLVAAGVGAALVPLLCLDDRDQNVVMLRMDGDLPTRTIAMAWHRDRYRSPAAREFVETARRVGAELERTMARTVR